MSVLIIDSEPGSEVRLKGFLGDYGFKHIDIVKTAKSARVFLNNLKAEKGIDELMLIIINYELDDADGYELCREIHNMPIAQNAYKIIIVSSAENKRAIIKTKQSCADDFSVKPYESPKFIKHLNIFSQNKMVLLIEDDPVIRKMLKALLHKKQFEVVVEVDGGEAYHTINSMNPPKLVLLDIGLPGMNGIKLLQHIRTRPLWKKTPILMLTGSTDVEDVKVSLSAGANDYIVKPFQLKDLVLRLDKYLDGK